MQDILLQDGCAIPHSLFWLSVASSHTRQPSSELFILNNLGDVVNFSQSQHVVTPQNNPNLF